jgi:hypothetical protein
MRTGVGALMSLAWGLGYSIGKGVNGIVIHGQTVTEHLAEFICWTGIFGPFDYKGYRNAPSNMNWDWLKLGWKMAGWGTLVPPM